MYHGRNFTLPLVYMVNIQRSGARSIVALAVWLLTREMNSILAVVGVVLLLATNMPAVMDVVPAANVNVPERSKV